MKRMLLEKFFPTSRIASIRKEICDRRQHTATFDPILYEGLIVMDKSMIDDPSSRFLMDKTPTTARKLISNMIGNTQQFDVRGSAASRIVNERLENKITELTSLVRQLAIGQYHTSPPSKVCGICTSTKHPTDACLALQKIEPNNVEHHLLDNNNNQFSRIRVHLF
ncbi:hypothetical protein CR513_08709, partial [Mucuna pruriens]